MSKMNSPYTAAITGGGFLFEETRILLPLLLAENSGELLRQEKVNNNLLHINAENSRLAFGKKAQNVRLAQKLIGWNINFVTDDDVREDSFEEKKTQCISQLSAELAIAPEKAEILVNNGYLTLEGLKTAGIADIAAIKGIDEATVNAISERLAKINQTSDGASDGKQQ